MADDKVEIKTDDELDVLSEDVAPLEVEEPEEELEPPKDEVKKPKKPKPEKGKGRKEKGKGEEKGFDKGEAWWKKTGSVLQRRGHSQRNIIMKAAQDAGQPFGRAMTAMRLGGNVEDKAKSLFD